MSELKICPCNLNYWSTAETRWITRKGHYWASYWGDFCPRCGAHLLPNGEVESSRAAKLEAALDRYPIVHTADEIRAMGHIGDYSCQRCGGAFDVELYIWLCRSCYEEFLKWQLDAEAAERSDDDE